MTDISATSKPLSRIEELRISNKKLLIRIGILILINTVVYALLIPGNFVFNFLIAIANTLGTFSLIGFGLGLFVAIIPYKNFPWGFKYLRSSLLVTLSLQIIMTLGMIVLSITYLRAFLMK